MPRMWRRQGIQKSKRKLYRAMGQGMMAQEKWKKIMPRRWRMQGTGKAKEHYAKEVVEGEHLESRRNFYQAMGQGMSQEKQRNIVPSHGTRKGEGKVE